MLRGEAGELFQPGEVISTRRRLIVVPPEAAAQHVDVELAHELKIFCDIIQVLSFVVVFEHRKRYLLGAVAGMSSAGELRELTAGRRRQQ